MSIPTVTASMGFLKLPDGPINIDYDNMNFVTNNYGVDVINQKPIVSRQSEMKFIVELEDLVQTTAIQFVIYTVIRYIEHYRIPGEIVLHLVCEKTDQDVSFICSAYEYIRPTSDPG